MKFFVDSADLDELKALSELGIVDGVTTNPSIIAKSGCNFLQRIEEICDIIPGPVSAEVAATEADQMIKEGKKLASIAENVTVKLPLTWDGLIACSSLTEEGIMTNVTLCFSAAQALMAAKAGATFISPFVGRLDDIGQDGLELIEEICTMFAQYDDIETQVLVASVRNPIHVVSSAKMGADVATLPPKTLRQMVSHPLTDKGLDAFVKDWEATGQSIL